VIFVFLYLCNKVEHVGHPMFKLKDPRLLEEDLTCRKWR